MTDQIALPFADTPGRARRTDPVTSKRAALNLKTGALKHRILCHLRAAGTDGATDFELWRHCDPNGRTHSAATRREELEASGLVRRTALTRPTDTPGNEGLVHVITADGVQLLADLERSIP